MGENSLRFRQIHMDFHTSPDIENVGALFNAEEFAETLERAHVNSVTCFARCHHGLLYYDSKKNPERIHPHLQNRHLLRDQIEACHKRGIRVPIYITVQWDHYTALEHPEWLSINEDGSVIDASDPRSQRWTAPGFYQTLCLNSPYRDFLKAHTQEVLEQFDPVDGLFFDILFPVSCCCKYCRESMLKQGLEPHRHEDRMKHSQQVIDEFKLEMSAMVRSYAKDCTIFYNRGHIGTPHRNVVDAYSHFELESLPSGLWGYLHFPATVRYARNLGLEYLAQTGKFHSMWGDFHSFKNKAALEFETFHMLALGAKCLIGDQLEPSGRLSSPVYDLIGSVYGEIEKKEPWCDQVTAVTEIAVFTPEEFVRAGGGNLPDSLKGAVRMLQESAQQFDVVDSKSDWSKYKLLILPDTIPVSDQLAQKLEAYLAAGGSIIASFESGLNPEQTDFNLKALGVTLNKEQTSDIFGELVRGKHYERFDYAEYVLPTGELGEGLPETEHVMYAKGIEVSASPEAAVLSKTFLPYFYRTYKHFCSHRQAPSSGQSGSDAIVRNQNVIYFAHPIFSQYNQNAPRWVKQLLVNAIKALIGTPLLTHSGPSSMIATVNEQTEQHRWVVHLLHYIPERRSEEIDVIEDVIPLYDTKVSIAVSKPVRSVSCVPEGTELPFESRDGRVEFVVPKVNGHQMICIQY
ncbi:alpha-amylase family protein [Marinicrinis lubricantis]|uniref:Alpha-amylase family protein n=1 Tax=Marinicrinis lubricantis TaxID=2086470 RepID=A0ABW1IVQ7_9BACL